MGLPKRNKSYELVGDGRNVAESIFESADATNFNEKAYIKVDRYADETDNSESEIECATEEDKLFAVNYDFTEGSSWENDKLYLRF